MGFDYNQPHLFTFELPDSSPSSNEILTYENRQMIMVMAEMGMNKSVIAAMMEGCGIKFSKDQLRFLCGSVVQHGHMWNDTTPEWLFEKITAERLQILFDEYEEGKKEGWRVGHAELVAVMYPRTMEAPMSGAFSDIYLWASNHASSKHYGWSIKEGWEKLGMADYPVKDEDMKPKGRYYYDYQRICGEIRRKVIKSAKI